MTAPSPSSDRRAHKYNRGKNVTDADANSGIGPLVAATNLLTLRRIKCR
jgi:hypothetical protein